MHHAHAKRKPVGSDENPQWRTPRNAFDAERNGDRTQSGEHAQQSGDAHERGVEMDAEFQPSRDGQDYAGHRQKEHWQVSVGCDAQLTPIA